MAKPTLMSLYFLTFFKIMNIIEIKNAIQHLPVEDFNELMLWLADYENEKWDKQIQQDYQAGRLDKLIADAMIDIENGDVKEI